MHSFDSKSIDFSKKMQKSPSPWRRRFVVLCACAIVVFIVFGAIAWAEKRFLNEKIIPGIKIAGVNVGYMTPADAYEVLQKFTDSFEQRGIAIHAQSPRGEKKLDVYSTLIAISDPDLTRRIFDFDIEKALKKAYQIGRVSFIERTRLIIAFLKNDETTNLPLDFYLNTKELRAILEEHFMTLEDHPRDASISINRNGDIQIIPSQEGFKFLYDEAVAQFKDRLARISDTPIEIPLVYEKPSVVDQDIKESLERARQIISKTPFTITYENRKWQIDKRFLGKWLALERGPDEFIWAINKDTVRDYLKIIAQDIDIEPENARFAIAGEKVSEFAPSKEGKKVDIEQNVAALEKNILDPLATSTAVELIATTTLPQITTENINTFGIRELIASGTSSYLGSPKNRRYNIQLGATQLNGILIKPDEEFSLLAALGEISEATGYLSELVIKGDRTVKEFGGGLCQIATTLFRAVLNAGLPIIQRQAHSFRVRYYEPPVGMDATVYNPWPDFKFINDTGNYILLQTRIEKNDLLVFEFYGTRDGRVTEMTSPIVWDIKEPDPPKFIESDELKPGEKKQVEKRVPGARAKFSRTVVYHDGKENKETFVSKYRPWQEVWLVGRLPTSSTETIIQ